MANYDLTYEGSRVQNILDTGDELRDAGYIFRGEATPSTVPGTPTERVAYIGGPGTYTNFGGSITVGAGCICVFKYTGSAWSNQVINTGLSAAISSEATTRSQADTALQNAINAINNNIGNGYVYAGVATPSTSPVTGKVFYLAVQAGTYTNFGSAVVTAGLNVIKYNGSAWSVDQVIAIDAEPTQGSDHLVKSGGVLNSIIQNGPAFDLSAYNAQGGVLATYADLSAALTALNALPAAYKKGGMSVKFVLTSDNKYIQARCMAQNFTIDVTQWQGVDDKPTAGSDNLVKSGGVDKRFTEENESNSLILSIINEVKQGTWETRNNIYPFWTIGKIEDSGIISDADKFPCTKSYIQPREGHTLRIVFDNTKYRLKIFTCTLNDGQISSTDGGTWNTTGTALYNYNATKGYMIQVAVASGLSGYPTAQEATFGIIITDDDEKTYNLDILTSLVRSQGYVILSAPQNCVFEEDVLNKKLYYKTTSIVAYIYGKSINKSWSDIKTQINDASRFVESAGGKGDCLRLDNNEALVLNTETGIFSIVNKSLAIQQSNIVVLINDDGTNNAYNGLFCKFTSLKNINSIFNHPDDNEEWKVEEDHTNKKLYLKLSGVLCNRGYINTAHAWAQIKTSINDDSRFVNAPSGDDNYLRLDQGEMFIYRFLGGTFNIINASNYNMMSEINLATNYNGCLRHGEILKSVIRKNTARISFLERNEVNEAIVAKTQAVVEDSAYDYANCFKFAMISDVHGNTPAFNVAIELSKWGQSNALLVGGDLNLLANEYDIDATNKYFTELARKLKDVECNVFTMRGNHDGLLEESESVGNERFTNAMFNSVLVKPFMSSANAGYFFKDFEDYKIRFICLNSAENIFIDDENVKGRRGFSQEQITWFENTLASTPDGYTVITSSHHMICKTQPEGASSVFHNVPANYQDILDAILYFKTNKPLCTHAFHVHGHVHQNFIYTYDGIQFVSTASCGWPGYNMDNYCVDTVNKKVGIMNLTYYNRHDREFTYE